MTDFVGKQRLWLLRRPREFKKMHDAGIIGAARVISTTLGNSVGDAESSAEQRSIECSGITTQTITQIQVTERT
ncbi:hypothetical protein [Sinorhizobium arboris]|uniref:hypothetical protein n=1 Tax=Sinorhizobium arboris TaxID=76745 RepID=UPI0012432EA9|nr:hypothetical protein [Sinorhizobium arboris]